MSHRGFADPNGVLRVDHSDLTLVGDEPFISPIPTEDERPAAALMAGIDSTARTHTDSREDTIIVSASTAAVPAKNATEVVATAPGRPTVATDSPHCLPTAQGRLA